MLAWIFHELLSRDHEDGCATWQPLGVGYEAYMGTSQGPTPEDAKKDGHIIRARCAPLSPASGFPVSWSQQVIHEISGLSVIPFSLTAQAPFLTLLRSSRIPGATRMKHRRERIVVRDPVIHRQGIRRSSRNHDRLPSMNFANTMCGAIESTHSLGHNPCAGEGVEE